MLRRESHLPLTVALLAALALGLTLIRWAELLTPAQWWAAALSPADGDPGQLVFHFSALPRCATALLAGAGLGLAGVLFQQALANPLASPTTLGVEAGSQLALTAAVVFAPSLLASGREMVTLAGGGLALLAVFACAARRGLSSVTLILAGLVVGLFCAALGVALRLLNQEFVAVLFLWGGGSLAQGDWSAPMFLAPRLAGLGLAAVVAVRALSVLSLDDASARAVGLSPSWARAVGLGLGALATSTVTAAVGVIGFLGLAAPQIARLAGARRFATRLALAPAIGGLILAAVDAAVGLLEGAGVADLPTGAATALLGAPLLLWLLPRLRLAAAPPPPDLAVETARRSGAILPLLASLLAAALLLALLLGRQGGGWIAEGWRLASPGDLGLLAPWRLPRSLVAGLAGAMLAAAGLILQRLTANPLAAPEVLGIGTGATAGLIGAMMLATAPGEALRTTAVAIGAFASVALVFAVGRRARFAPDHVLLTGIALSALIDVAVVAFLALGDPRASLLLSWMAGSTYYATWSTVAATAASAVILLPLALLLRRWLDILPLGEAAALSLGLPLGGVRAAVMAIAALLTAAAMLVTGPLTFVGLVGPHLAKLVGLRRTAPQLVGAALIGALVMVAADLAGRTVIAPRQLPAGLVAALIGLPYLVWSLARRR